MAHTGLQGLEWSGAVETMTHLDWIWEAEQTFQSMSKGQNESVAYMAASMISGSFFFLFNRVCPLQMSGVEGRVERRCKVLNLVLGRSVQHLPPAFLRTSFKDWMEKIVLCISKEGLKTAD